MKFGLVLATLTIPFMVQAAENKAPAKQLKPTENLALIDFWRATATDVDHAVRAGSNVNELSSRFDATPLMRAASISAQSGDFELLDYFIEAGADANRVNSHKQTALMIALENKRQKTQIYDVVERLINIGADVNAADEDGRTVLMYAIKYCPYLPVTDMLIKYGANINIADNNNETPLMYARTTEMFELLLKYGANINFKDSKGETVLLKTPAHARMLLKYGASYNVVNYNKETPLMLSAKLGYLDSCKALVEEGELVNERHELSGKTALFYAVEHEKPKVVQYLLSVGAKYDLRDKTGKTALDYATRKQREVIQSFVASKNVVREGKHPFTTDGVRKYLENNFYYNSPKKPEFIAYLSDISCVPQNKLKEILESVYDEKNATDLVISEMEHFYKDGTCRKKRK